MLSEFPSDALLSIPAEHANEDGDVRYKHADNKHWLALHCLGVVYMFSGLAIGKLTVIVIIITATTTAATAIIMLCAVVVMP